jgi:hypothetical protein
MPCALWNKYSQMPLMVILLKTPEFSWSLQLVFGSKLDPTKWQHECFPLQPESSSSNFLLVHSFNICKCKCISTQSSCQSLSICDNILWLPNLSLHMIVLFCCWYGIELGCHGKKFHCWLWNDGSVIHKFSAFGHHQDWCWATMHDWPMVRKLSCQVSDTLLLSQFWVLLTQFSDLQPWWLMPSAVRPKGYCWRYLRFCCRVVISLINNKRCLCTTNDFTGFWVNSLVLVDWT